MNVNWYSDSICYLFKTPEFNLLLLKLWGAICYTPQTIGLKCNFPYIGLIGTISQPIDYGDITPTSTATKLFSMLLCWWVGFGFIEKLFTGMVSHVLDLQESYC